MEKYFKVVKRSAAQLNSELEAKDNGNESSTSSTIKPKATFHPHSNSSLNKVLLDTLGDETNPITHSDLADRSGVHTYSLLSM
jgi:hypothetical protein